MSRPAMRRFTLGLCALLLVELFFSPPAAARRKANRSREPITAIQAVEADSGLVLLSRTGWAKVEDQGGRHRVRLRNDETLSTIAETASGWVAAGVRTSPDASSILVISDSGSTSERLPALPQRAEVQLLPVLLVSDGDLVGAAWLEGRDHRSLAVRFAQWRGIAWGPAVTISRPGPGSQTGLSGAAFNRGELLLVWSRFDGSDDEVHWSWRRGSSWSRPARIGDDNRTPDIAPVVAGSRRGASLVWGRLEGGHYRLLSRRFESGTWQDEQALGPPGSIFPSLTRRDERLYVLFRTVQPTGWSLGELAADASLVRHAAIKDSGAVRPVVQRLPSPGPVLRWIGPHRSASAAWSVP